MSGEEAPRLRAPWQPGESGNPSGRPKGARNKLSEAFIAAMHDDFAEHGPKAIEDMRTQDPGAYVRVIASILPKQVEIKEDAFGDLTDDQLAAIVAAARNSLDVHQASGGGTSDAEEPEPPGGVSSVH